VLSCIPLSDIASTGSSRTSSAGAASVLDARDATPAVGGGGTSSISSSLEASSPCRDFFAAGPASPGVPSCALSASFAASPSLGERLRFGIWNAGLRGACDFGRPSARRMSLASVFGFASAGVRVPLADAGDAGAAEFCRLMVGKCGGSGVRGTGVTLEAWYEETE
jgi:hypothetical protein